jgi:hypothetical protein
MSLVFYTFSSKITLLLASNIICVFRLAFPATLLRAFSPYHLVLHISLSHLPHYCDNKKRKFAQRTLLIWGL